MNRTAKILIINLIIILFVFFAADIFCFVKNVNYNGRNYVYKSPIEFCKYYLFSYKKIFYSYKDYESVFIKGKRKFFRTVFREPMNTSSTKPPVLIMGCSFGFGHSLSEESSFIGKLVKYTDRPVYNRAMGARGLGEMLFQLKNPKFYSIIPKPEWFIYVFIPEQIRRAQIPCSVVDLGVFYDSKFNIRPDVSFPLLYTIKNHTNYLGETKSRQFAINMLSEMRKEIIEHWGDDVKNIFLYYDNNDEIYEYFKSRLKYDGYDCYSVKELVDVDLFSDEYKNEDKVHPSEKAWELITPALIQKAGI